MLTTKGLYQSLLGASGQAIQNALQHGGPPQFAVPSNEPSAVAAVAWVGVPSLVATWRPITQKLGHQISVHSVFCHGSPQVDFTDKTGKPQTCELADLLVAVDDRTTGTMQDRRAVLIQAKIFSSTGSIAITSTTADQLELYETWPAFSFVSSAYNKGARDFTAAGQPGKQGESGRYGGVDLGSSAGWENILPTSATTMRRGSGRVFNEFLAGMVTGQPAEGREAIAGGQDDWSSTIDELLKVTAAQTTVLASTLGAGGQHPRGVVTLALEDRGQVPPGDVIGQGPEGGLSFVHLIVTRAPD